MFAVIVVHWNWEIYVTPYQVVWVTAWAEILTKPETSVFRQTTKRVWDQSAEFGVNEKVSVMG